jgi:hypothetical protein
MASNDEPNIKIFGTLWWARRVNGNYSPCSSHTITTTRTAESFQRVGPDFSRVSPLEGKGIILSDELLGFRFHRDYSININNTNGKE